MQYDRLGSTPPKKNTHSDLVDFKNTKTTWITPRCWSQSLSFIGYKLSFKNIRKIFNACVMLTKLRRMKLSSDHAGKIVYLHFPGHFTVAFSQIMLKGTTLPASTCHKKPSFVGKLSKIQHTILLR
ncbi:hypothetical protein XENOCAPTIV_029630 [Xenoophorus captivus]|uniref:Uncharacterized protein n=1 Tax=Xenoophorus captivus TaxID=1517983 RepID=A0ABV0Q7J8_9TELE